ncbi:hypothetical protein HN51_024714 [Arachis hypogaea]
MMRQSQCIHQEETYLHQRLTIARFHILVVLMQIVDSIISHRSFVDSSFIEHSVVGIRSRINSNDIVMLRADLYKTKLNVTALLAEGRVPIGIGENTKIKYTLQLSLS